MNEASADKNYEMGPVTRADRATEALKDLVSAIQRGTESEAFATALTRAHLTLEDLGELPPAEDLPKDLLTPVIR